MDIVLNLSVAAVVLFIIAVPAAPPIVTLESVIEPQVLEAHPKVVVDPVSMIHALLGFRLFTLLRNVLPLLVTIPLPKELEEPIVKVVLLTLRPPEKVFLPLKVVAALMIRAPIPVP
jgi:hypothetical protein